MALRKTTKKQKEEKQPLDPQVKKKLDKIYSKKSVGRISLKPLEHKDGTPFDDIDYLELLGRKAIKMEQEQKLVNPNIPVNYAEKGYNLECVKLAKTVCEAIDDKRPRQEIKDYILSSLDFSELE